MDDEYQSSLDYNFDDYEYYDFEDMENQD